MLFDPNWKPKTADVDAVGEIMLKAADYLETHRWGKNDLVLRNGAVCLIGSMIKVETGKVYNDESKHDNYDHPLTNIAIERLEGHLSVEYSNAVRHSDTICITDWNDAHSRKKDEVISLLRTVAYLK